MARLLRSRWFVVCTVAVACAVALFLTVRPSQDEPPADFGTRSAAQGDAGETSAGAATGPSRGDQVPGAPPAGSGESRTSAGQDETATPSRLRMPRVGLNAPVDSVGVAKDGTVEVPADPRKAGWYRHGPAPGASAGSAVLVGHVDSRTGDLGALAALYQVRAGDSVTVERAGAPAARYTVTTRQVIDQDELPDEMFARDGRPVLTLITCAAPYDRSRGGYQNNLVVTAVPKAG